MINYIDPVIFWNIRWYAVFILIGIVIAVVMGIKEGKKLGIWSDFVYWGVVITVPIAIFGARLWYVIFKFDEFDSFAEIIGLRGGLSGLAIQGGVIAALITIYFYCKKRGVVIYRVLDIVAPGFLIGQIFGRWGNFCNHELYGPVVNNVKLFKALLPSFITENMYIDDAYRHPTFLYESLLNLVALIIMLVARRYFKKLRSGDLMGFYLIWYGIVRCITESLRLKGDANDPLMLGNTNISVSITMSIVFIILGAVFLILKTFKGPKEYYLDILEEVKKNKVEIVLFDLDGTLIDTRALIFSSFVYTFEKYFPNYELTDEELESFFGPPLKETFSRYSDDPKQVDEMIEYYRAYNIAEHDNYVKPMDGCKEVIRSLKRKHYKIGIVSSKKRNVVEMGLDLAGIRDYIDVLVCEDEVKKAKPDPEGILKALEHLDPNVDKNKVLYIGDHPSDIKAAKAAGVKSCGVMYSSKASELDEENPDYEIYKLVDLFVILVE